MLGLSDAARTALIDGTAAARGRVDLYNDGLLVRAGVALDDLRPSAVAVDGTAVTRRTVELNFAPDEAGEVMPLLPLRTGPIVPYSVEAYCYVDLTLPGGTVETLAQGVFGLRRSAADAAGGQLVTAVGRDRSQRIIDATLSAPYDVAAGTNYATAIHDLIDAGVPDLVYEGFEETSTPHASAGLHFAVGDDRWARATEMADSAGKQLTFSTTGTLVLADVPDPADAPLAWQYAVGADALVEKIGQSLDADQTRSHAVAIGQPADAASPPVRADAYDDDPTSPTYWLGPFGDRLVRMESSYIATAAQATDAAAALLLRNRGLIEDLTLSALSVYAHEDGDVVLVQDAALGVDAHYVLSRFPVPLGPGVVEYTARSRRVA